MARSKKKTGKENVRVSVSTVGKIFVQRALKSIGVVLLVLATIYVLFAITVMRVVPTTSGAGFVPVKNITADGGMIPVDEEVLVQRGSPAGKEVFDRLKQSFMPMSDGAVGKVIAGPYGKMTWNEPGIISVDGEIKDVEFMPTSDNNSPLEGRSKFLEGEYLLECVSGACYPGTAFIASEDYIVGSLITSTNYVKNK